MNSLMHRQAMTLYYSPHLAHPIIIYSPDDWATFVSMALKAKTPAQRRRAALFLDSKYGEPGPEPMPDCPIKMGRAASDPVIVQAHNHYHSRRLYLELDD